MNPETIFIMDQYDQDVIGKSLNEHTWDEREVLNDKFGIVRTAYDSYFCDEALEGFTKEEGDVLKLFIYSIAPCETEYDVPEITAKDWLLLAKDQLAKM